MPHKMAFYLGLHVCCSTHLGGGGVSSPQRVISIFTWVQIPVSNFLENQMCSKEPFEYAQHMFWLRTKE